MSTWQRLRRYSKTFAFKCIAIGVILTLVASLCVMQLASIQLIDGRQMAQAATASRTSRVTLSAKRGRILDANGTVLAQSVERYTIVANPEAAQEFTPITCNKNNSDYCHQIDGKPVGVTGAAAVGRLLSKALGISAMELGADLSISGQYVVLKKDVTPQVKRSIDDLNLGGIVWGELSSERIYSDGDLMGSLLGGVNDAGDGVAGIEQMENTVLTGTDGHQTYQRGNYGGEEIPGTMTESVPAQDGSDVNLTIDRDVQWYVKKIMKDAKAKYGSPWVIGVVQDIQTGEILALADSDEVDAGTDEAKLGASRAVSETFEPGSIGKLISASGYLQTGVHRMTDQFTVPNSVTDDGQTFKDAFTHGDMHWTLAGIIQQSSNNGMVLAGKNYTDDQRYEFLTKFGIGQSTGLDLPGESNGVLTNPSSWDLRTRNTVLFGQGYTVNVLQLNNVVATIANKGVRLQQSIIKSTTNADGKTTEATKGTGTRVLDEQVASDVMNAMESVAENYNKFVKVDGYRMAAKSGTAEVAGDNGSLSSIISDYSVVIPADNPRFAITVVMKDPQGSFGGLTAGPVAAQICEFLMQKYEVPVSSPRKDAIPVTW
ncbi:penicillin-binding protein 2 [Bifidobacterium reuteri]|uniref:Peptidoglycan synthetase n=3 Tax=Bifidobacterium TaxID=1678 RepID=A0A087CSD7_9BIFI|nr:MULTISPECIES: penicillin-binding protein 2 [Bifidobacterium]KAA8824865.1 penicillin-binding protein 2 [Bifidobacterium reuteri]KFI86187.1 peptidoglycan synthetase [Bifidobacterium reuteri DSM 23975]TPF78329.1 cell division protein [Bifidobacterium sp. UTCIF-1]TPF81250.1 cell division protein [Bifidobacterium sp. UTCIF-24]TPF82031.1 cell division protein [Bifidobacterium sp. UTCIF-3]